MSADTRLKLGNALLALGLVMPAGTVFVAATNWRGDLKALLDGILLFGLEIMAIPAVALMGKENYDRIVNRVKTVLKRLKPAGDVGRTRYRIGLALFGVPLLLGWIASYLPDWRPEDYPVRIGINLVLDLTIVSSLFVLGGDFWDKLRVSFARVMGPPDCQGDGTTVARYRGCQPVGWYLRGEVGGTVACLTSEK